MAVRQTVPDVMHTEQKARPQHDTQKPAGKEWKTQCRKVHQRHHRKDFKIQSLAGMSGLTRNWQMITGHKLPRNQRLTLPNWHHPKVRQCQANARLRAVMMTARNAQLNLVLRRRQDLESKAGDPEASSSSHAGPVGPTAKPGRGGSEASSSSHAGPGVAVRTGVKRRAEKCCQHPHPSG